jgi:hypothetical protein
MIMDSGAPLVRRSLLSGLRERVFAIRSTVPLEMQWWLLGGMGTWLTKMGTWPTKMGTWPTNRMGFLMHEMRRALEKT